MSTVSEDSRQAAVEGLRAAAEAGSLSAAAAENAARWLTEPQYVDYVPRIVELVDERNFDELDRLFWEVIPFGTGGRRGHMADLGTATINARTIAESAHGLAVHAIKTNGQPGKAVVAHDTRNRSREFAETTATTLAAHGFQVYLFESFRTTPALSFAVRHLGCDVGVMITASHNPPSDNGFKAYWNTGGQVLPPHDSGTIDEVLAAKEIPTLPLDEALADGRVTLVGAEVDEAYLASVEAQSLCSDRDVKAIYSPLHGSGETNCYAIIQRAGFDDVEIFEPHRQPDGNFPNVAKHYPNPENTAVFDPLAERGNETGADLLLASDPDADRVGVCARDSAGEFVPLTGNQVAALAVDHVLRHRAVAGTLSPEHFVVITLVSTPLFSAIARAHGVRAIDDLLVGFKYIAETMDANDPAKFAFGAEESLGYLAGEYARDKDAAIGVLYTLEHAAQLKARGSSLLQRLDELYVEHGFFLEGQTSTYCEGSEGKAKIDGLMNTLRENPPARIGETTLVRVRDYHANETRSIPAGTTEPLPKPHGNVLIFESAEGPVEFRIAVRPSGTEPKIKFYFFGRATVESAGALESVKASALARYDDLKTALGAWIEDQLRN